MQDLVILDFIFIVIYVGMSPTGEKESSGSRSSGDWHNIQGEIQQSYNQLQRQLSQEFHR